MKKLYLIPFLIFTLSLSGQVDRILIRGVVKSNSLALVNVHVINLSSNKGSLSNQNGEFKISVKENDTLLFSNIQYEVKELIITNEITNKNQLVIFLKIKNNELDEVIVVESKNIAKVLQLPNAGKKPLDKLERNLNHYSQASVPIVILATLLGQRGGIDDIYNIISGNRKKDRKLKELLEEDIKSEMNREYIQKIRNHFQDEFFIEEILIPKEKIDVFLYFCLPRDVIGLFQKGRYLDLIDIFIGESNSFKSID
jgi:hypothetical protein